MKRSAVVAVAVCLASIWFTPGIALAANKCANPQGSVERRACAMSAAGPEALRRFIYRTRGIYNLYYPDFARREP